MYSNYVKLLTIDDIYIYRLNFFNVIIDDILCCLFYYIPRVAEYINISIQLLHVIIYREINIYCYMHADHINIIT